MGIPGSSYFFRPISKSRRVTDFKGRRVLVDGNSVLHKQCIGRRGSGTEPTRKDGKSINHIYSIFMYVTGLLEKGILPYFVFDGKAPVEKTNTIKERHSVKKTAIQKCKTIDDKLSSEYVKNFKKSFHITHKQINECKRLLKAMGITVIQALEEADAQLAALSHIYCDEFAGIITEDPDVLVYAGTTMLKDFSFRKNSITEVNRASLLLYLRDKANIIRSHAAMEPIEIFTHINFIDFAVMMGTDYKVAGQDTKQLQISGITVHEKHESLFELFVLSDCDIVKMVEMMKLINELANMNDQSNIYFIPHNYAQSMLDIRNVYLKATVIDPQSISLELIKPDPAEIIKILCVENDMDQNFVSGRIARIITNYMTFTNMPIHSNKQFASLSGYHYKFCKKRSSTQGSHVFNICRQITKPTFTTSNRFDAIAT
jgi:5'-3' exonuclease